MSDDTRCAACGALADPYLYTVAVWSEESNERITRMEFEEPVIVEAGSTGRACGPGCAEASARDQLAKTDGVLSAVLYVSSLEDTGEAPRYVRSLAGLRRFRHR